MFILNMFFSVLLCSSLAVFQSGPSFQPSKPLPLLSRLLALVWAIPAFEISCSSNPLIRVSRWDYHRGQPQSLPPPPPPAIVGPAEFDLCNVHTHTTVKGQSTQCASEVHVELNVLFALHRLIKYKNLQLRLFFFWEANVLLSIIT